MAPVEDLLPELGKARRDLREERLRGAVDRLATFGALRFAGLRQIRGTPPGTFTVYSSAETAARVEQVRQAAGARSYRSDVLLQAVVIGRNPEDAAARIAASAPGLTVEQLLDTPFVLLAQDADQAAIELRRRQQTYGFDSVTTHQPNLEALGEVIAACRGADAPESSERAAGNSGTQEGP